MFPKTSEIIINHQKLNNKTHNEVVRDRQGRQIEIKEEVTKGIGWKDKDQ